MTNSVATLEVHDFRQPRQLMPTSWRALQRWYAEGCELVAERWKALGLDVTLSHHHTRVLSLRSALETIPEPGWGARGTLGATSIDTLLACQPRLLRALASGLLGDTADETEDVEFLTAVEESMAELLLTEFLGGVGDAWPGAEPLNCRFRSRVDQPQRTRMYPPRTTLVVTTLCIHAAAEESGDAGAESAGQEEGAEESPPTADSPGPEIGQLVWLMPQVEIEDLLEIECANPEPVRTTPNPAIPQIMREVPVCVTVELGRTRLSMSELTSLRTGDVVILEQPVNHPLNARVGNAFKFSGRPGRIGARRCLEIQKILEDTPDALAASPQH